MDGRVVAIMQENKELHYQKQKENIILTYATYKGIVQIYFQFKVQMHDKIS